MTMKNIRFRLGLMLALTTSFASTLVGCAEKAINRDIDEKIRVEPKIKNVTQLRDEITHLFSNLPNLTQEQKQRLTELKETTYSKMNNLQEVSLKLRAILIKDVLSNEDLTDEIQMIKDRMRDIDHRKLELTFSSIEHADHILGKRGPHRAEVMKELLQDFYNGDDN